jgi:hypothetical protein
VGPPCLHRHLLATLLLLLLLLLEAVGVPWLAASGAPLWVVEGAPR